MSGHSKWAQIKHQKGAADARKSKEFSKLSRLISIAARKGENPEMNPELRSAIEKARSQNMPLDNIERAIKRGAGKITGESTLEQIRCEAYGPAGVAMIIDVITDNRNRSISEIKHLLNEYGGKLGEPGSAIWAFDYKDGLWKPKIKIEVLKEDKEKLDKLIRALDENEDVQNIYVNV